MDILVAFEKSGVVRDALRSRGHNAVSCDFQLGTFLGPRIQGDVLDVLSLKWDMVIAHPPCTYLCRQAARWYENPETRHLVDLAAEVFNKVKNCNAPMVAIENPVPHKRAKGLMGDYQQIIQPWQFGHDYSKKTCLWLKGLPLLQPTDVVELSYYTTPKGRRYTKGWYFTPRNSDARSVTFLGVAEAMADQWGDL